jgi:hypothetical protein
MLITLEPKLNTWRIHVRSALQWSRPSDLMIRAVKRTFESLGFRIVELPSEYYNPTARNRFLVKHEKPSAMTLWLLQYKDSFGSVEIAVAEE